MNHFIDDIRGMAEAMIGLTRGAVTAYAPIVDSIVAEDSCDIQLIERTLDGVLDFCFDPEALLLFKKLCRHYDAIDPAATADYVRYYREMWDSEAEERS